MRALCRPDGFAVAHRTNFSPPKSAAKENIDRRESSSSWPLQLIISRLGWPCAASSLSINIGRAEAGADSQLAERIPRGPFEWRHSRLSVACKRPPPPPPAGSLINSIKQSTIDNLPTVWRGARDPISRSQKLDRRTARIKTNDPRDCARASSLCFALLYFASREKIIREAVDSVKGLSWRAEPKRREIMISPR